MRTIALALVVAAFITGCAGNSPGLVTPVNRDVPRIITRSFPQLECYTQEQESGPALLHCWWYKVNVEIAGGKPPYACRATGLPNGMQVSAHAQPDVCKTMLCPAPDDKPSGYSCDLQGVWLDPNLQGFLFSMEVVDSAGTVGH